MSIENGVVTKAENARDYLEALGVSPDPQQPVLFTETSRRILVRTGRILAVYGRTGDTEEIESSLPLAPTAGSGASLEEMLAIRHSIDDR